MPERHRSPAYPALSLSEAVDRIRKFHDAVGRNAVDADSAMNAWGDKRPGGLPNRRLAALVAFGLLERSLRKVRLSDLGYKILVLEPDSHPGRLAAIKEAAVKPKLHDELLREWPGTLPSDQAMRNHLVLERHFNPRVVDRVIRTWRATYDYAKLGSTESLSSGDEDTGDGSPDDPGVEIDRQSGDIPEEIPPPAGERPRMKRYALPLSGGVDAAVEGPFPLSPSDWERLSVVLEAMKPSLVTDAVDTEAQDQPAAARPSSDQTA